MATSIACSDNTEATNRLSREADLLCKQRPEHIYPSVKRLAQLTFRTLRSMGYQPTLHKVWRYE